MDNTITRNIEKGVRLMESALRMYSNGASVKGYRTMEKAMEHLAEAYVSETTRDGADKMKYGDNLNFGALYKVFESNAGAMFKDPARHHALKSIVETINGNKVLKDEFNAYNAFTNPTDVSDAGMYVNEACAMIRKHPASELLENNRKLMEAIRANGLDENVQFTDEETELFESVEYLMTSKGGFSNIAKVSAAKEILRENVERNNVNTPEKTDIDEVYANKIGDLLEKYDAMLSDDEIDLIKETMDGKSAEAKFNSLKSELTEEIGRLSESGADSEQWAEVLEKIGSKEFNRDTALQDIAELMEVKSELGK